MVHASEASADAMPTSAYLLKRDMHSGNFFEWLGNLLGAVIRGIVHALTFLLNALGHAVGNFTDGFAHALGLHASTFNIVLLIIGLLMLVAGVRALLARSIVAGIIWLVLAALLLSKLIAR